MVSCTGLTLEYTVDVSVERSDSSVLGENYGEEKYSVRTSTRSGSST